MHAKMHAAMHAAKPFLLCDLTMALIACKMATINDPKQMDPNEVVIVRLNAFLDGLSNSPELKYHVAATPLKMKGM